MSVASDSGAGIGLKVAGANAHSQPWFVESTQFSGIQSGGASAGISWGEINNDGWPDVWIGGHVETPPLVLVNQQDGTFADMSELVTIAADADLHGAAFADYDNDGDQDLFALVGGDAGTRPNPNVLLENDNGQLNNVAKAQGLDFPWGRGRTPLWVDANYDGRLDVLVVNRLGADGGSGSALFIQGSQGFVPLEPALELPPTPRSWFSDIWYRLLHGMHMRWQKFGSLQTEEALAQLIDINGDRTLELLAYGDTTRVFEFERDPGATGVGANTDESIEATVVDVSNDYYLGTESYISDIAVGDFDGDLQSDLYLARVRSGASDVVQPSTNVLQASFRGSTSNEPNRLQFVSSAKLSLHLVDAWELSDRLPPVFVGSSRQSPKTRIFTLDPQNPLVAGPIQHTANSHEILIHYEPELQRWTISNWLRPLNLEVTSEGPITDVAAQGFKLSKGHMPDKILFQRESEFESVAIGEATGCHSVVAGDFDNDMDLDLYLACAAPVQNAANMLLENLGNATFQVVEDAGGAAGSNLGRGESVATADYNRDGFLDLLVTNGRGAAPFTDQGPYQLFTNQGNNNHWLEINLIGTRSNRDGIGAVVLAQAGGVSQIREQGGGIHGFAQNHSRLHFGLGSNTRVDLTIWWPSGLVQKLAGQASKQIIDVVEPEAE